MSVGHDVFQAIADPTRRSIVKLLADGELSIVAVSERFPMSRTAVKKHLQVLEESGLVTVRRVGRETRYQLRPDPLAEVRQWLMFFEGYWTDRLQSLKDVLERPQNPS